MSEDRVLEALKALREADRECEAGPQVEVRLMQAVRRRRVRHLWIGAGAAVAAMAAAAAVVILLHARPEPVRHAARPQKVVATVTTPEVETQAPRVAVSAPPPKSRRSRPMPWVLHEVDTEFYPLMEVAPPFERGELVRVTVPASTMRDAGYFVEASHWDDPVQADVLYGQEGLARAIRFVSYQ
jgi:hypothetical protein